MIARARGVLACAVIMAAAVRVEASAPPPVRAERGWFSRILDGGRAKLEPKPPAAPLQPIVVKWKAQRIGSLDLGAPIVALAAADLDGDGKAELYAVTAREVIAIAANGRLRELGRVAFAGDPAPTAPRDTVGTAFFDGKARALVASVSTRARTLRVAWRGGQLVGEPGEPAFALCAGEHAQLAVGRDYFGDAATAYYTARCATLVDAQGMPLHVRAQLSVANKLDVRVQRCNGDGRACAELARHELSNVGVAFELADVGRDGTPEVIFAGAGAPGDPDRVEVRELGVDDAGKKPTLIKTFSAGGVAGIAVGDVDGDGAPEAIAAVRLVGASRVDLWRLN